MKQVLIFLVLSSGISVNGLCQRHVKGISYLEVQAGFVDQWAGDHVQGALLYSRVINRQWYWQAGVTGAIRDTPVQSVALRVEKYYGQSSAFYTLGSLFGHSLYFNVGAGPLLGVERIQQPPERFSSTFILGDPVSKFVLGLQGSVNTELFISNSVIITLNYQQRWSATSRIDNLDGIMALGAKFYLQ